MNTGVEFSEVEVTYGSHRVLKGVSIDIAPGSWHGILGPNGAGKSSLLKTMIGAVPYRGSVHVGGASVETFSRRERAKIVAYVPQRPIYPQGMAVFDYVLLGRTPYLGTLGAETESDLALCWAALADLDMTDFAERDISTLSGGETQRLSLARVLAQQADIVVLDEATASLDVAAQHQVMELIDTLRTARGMTVVAAIHDLTAAAQFCDRVSLLDSGTVVGSGPPDEVLTEELLGDVFEQSIRVIDVDGSTVIVSLRSQEVSK